MTTPLTREDVEKLQGFTEGPWTFHHSDSDENTKAAFIHRVRSNKKLLFTFSWHSNSTLYPTKDAAAANGELVAAAPSLHATCLALFAENARLREKLIAARTETFWDAYYTGYENNGLWHHGCTSDGEWLARECGFDPKDRDYPADEIKSRIPEAAKMAVEVEE